MGLIPARAGSKRIPNKNARSLGAHPLIAYAIAAARSSGILTSVVVSTDSERIAAIARHYGAETPFLRPARMAGDCSPDIEWVRHALEALKVMGQVYDAFSILRPTSPFRQPETIVRAWTQFSSAEGADSLRAVERCEQHPGKMWLLRDDRIVPLLPNGPEDPPWHSRPYQALPEVYVQNASLEIAWCRAVWEQHSISGRHVVPFFCEGFEGFDVNDARDWWLAEHLIASNEAKLPEVKASPLRATS